MSERTAGRSVGTPDIPITSFEQDGHGLKVGHYARGLIEFVRQTKTPISIGIQGDWGTGKSSLISLVKEEIKGSGIPIVSIETWQFSQAASDESLPYLVLWSIAEQLGGIGGSRPAKLLDEIGRALLTLGGHYLRAFHGIDASPIVANVQRRGWDPRSWFDRRENAVGDEPSYAALRNKVAAIRSLREKLHELVRGQVDKAGRVLVIIDDLDRVKPKLAVEILELLKTFLIDVHGLVFLIACDYEVVRLGVEAKLGVREGELRGRSFFDKIIQVPFHVPVHSYDLKPFLHGLLSGFGINVEGLPDAERAALIKVVGAATSQNPRSIKRVVNALDLLVLTQGHGEGRDNRAIRMPAGPHLLFVLVCLQQAFPRAYQRLSANPSRDVLEALSQYDESSGLDDDTTDAFEEDPEKVSCIARYLATLLTRSATNGHDAVLRELVGATGVTSVGPPLPSPSADLPAVVEAYNATCPEELRALGRGGKYRMIQVPRWPARLHYELLRKSDRIGVELHVEHDDILPITDALRALVGGPRPGLSYSIEWDPAWYKRRGRLIVGVPADGSPAVVADAMISFIGVTREPITSALAEHGLLDKDTSW